MVYCCCNLQSLILFMFNEFIITYTHNHIRVKFYSYMVNRIYPVMLYYNNCILWCINPFYMSPCRRYWCIWL